MTIENVAWAVFECLNGSLANSSTNYVEGDTVKVHLKTDLKNNLWGFEIDRFDYQ